MEIVKKDRAVSNLEKVLSWLKNYKEETNCRGVVLGLSGGKDSTVVAMLAKKVWGAENVFGIIMPNGFQSDIDDAIEIASELGIRNAIVNIGAAIEALTRDIQFFESRNHLGENDWFENCPPITDKAKTNIPPRIRMTALYAVAQSIGYRVIGTGNASEAYIGWTTKWGDSANDFNPIAHLTCTEVIEIGKILAQELGLDEKYVNKSPADGLTGKTDEDNFGFTYEELDRYIHNDTSIPEETARKIERLHVASEHKRQPPNRCNPNIW